MASNLLQQALKQIDQRNRQKAITGNPMYANQDIENAYSSYFNTAAANERASEALALQKSTAEANQALSRESLALSKSQSAFSNALALQQAENQKSSQTTQALSNIANLGVTLYGVDRLTGGTGQKALTSMVSATPIAADAIAGYGTFADTTAGAGLTWGSSEYTQALQEIGLSETQLSSLVGTEGAVTSDSWFSSAVSSAWDWLSGLF